MSLRNEEIFPAIIVIIEQMRTPTGKSESRAAHAGRVGHILEAAFAVVVKEVIAFIRKVRDDNVGATVIVVIAEVSSHPCKRFAVLIVSNACGKADFGERAISVVVVQKPSHRSLATKMSVKPSSS